MDVWAILALMVALLIVTSRLVATNWTKNLPIIQYLAIMAVIFGIGLGASKFSNAVVKLFALAYGLFGIPWLLGITLSPGLDWHDRLISMGGRVAAATTLFLQKKPVYDPILFLLLMSILFWTLCLSAGYYLARYAAPWMTIIPSGVALLVINHYDHFSDSGLSYIGAFILLALLIVGRLTFLQKRAEWQRDGVVFAPETSGDLGRATLLVVAALVVFSWSLPALAAGNGTISDFWANNILRPWSSLTNRIGDAFSSLQARVVVVQDFYGNSLALTTGSHLSNDVVFTVSPSIAQPAGVRYYWQVRTYDTYVNGQWTAADFQAKNFTPITYFVNYPDYQDRTIIEFVFTSRISQQNMPSGSMPVWASVPGQILISTAADGKDDVAGLIASPPLHVGEVYHVRSSVSVPTVSDLRATIPSYPAEISNRYLEIPSDLAPEFKQLALQITSGMNDPYDKANAITLWLRDNIKYQETIPPIPVGQDPVAWFLFQLKQGFCNYYASAEVLLLRSIGIPARISVGYAQGTYDALSNQYVVHMSDAHAWPEVYFPGLGWVEFEPTVSQPARSLPLGGASSDTQLPTPTPGPSGGSTPPPGSTNPNYKPIQSGLTAAERQQQLLRTLTVAGGGVAIILLVSIYLVFVRPRLREIPFPVRLEKGLRKRNLSVPGWLHRWSHYAGLTPFELAFNSLGQALWLLRQPVLPAQTPSERVDLLSETLPIARQPARELLSEYERAEYSPYPADLPRARHAGSQVRRLAIQAFFRRLLKLQRTAA